MPPLLNRIVCVSDAAAGGICFDGFWTAGQRTDPDPAGMEWSTFVWKVLTLNGYVEWPINYNSWVEGQPDNTDGSESCLTVANALNYHWNDASCSTELCYMCEYETVMPFGFIGDGYNCSGNIGASLWNK